MSAWHLAQVNIGILQAPLESPQLSEFKDGLDIINALAESSAGFVWRLVDDTGANATELRPFDDDRLINMSVWTSIEALRAFVYKSDHRIFLARRKEWFKPMSGNITALWWIPAGHIPTTDEAREKLGILDAHGPTSAAFTFAKHFSPSDQGSF
jgi:Domain of unknown function (DUF3291)